MPLKLSIGKMLNRITSSIATCTIFGFIAIFCLPLYRTEPLMAQSPPAQDEISKLQSEVSKRSKSPEEVNRAMREKFPNSSFPYYEPANGCSTPKGISWGWGNNDLFKSACDNHDICYTTPGNPKGYCDRKMLSEMFQICEGGSFLCKSWARDYYNAVNLGAQSAYDTAQKQEREYIKSIYAWLSNIAGTWRGEWSNPNGYLFTFEAQLTVSSSNNVSGTIIWKLVASPHSYEQSKLGLSATEYVGGTYNPEKRLATIAGRSKDDPHNVIGLDEYKIVVSEDGQSIIATTSNHGNWQGRLSGKKVAIDKR